MKLHWSSILHDVRHCLWVSDYALRISGITKEGRKEYAWSYLSDRTSWHPPSPNVFTPSINNEQKEKEKSKNERKKERKPAAIKEWYNYERLTQSKEENEKLWKLFVSLHASTLLNIFAKIILICIFIPLQLQWQWMITISKQKKIQTWWKAERYTESQKMFIFVDLCLFVVNVLKNFKENEFTNRYWPAS